jgi:sugar/nucleoside kinase (ribokinase family)
MYDLICVGTTTIDLYFKGQSLTESQGAFNLSHGDKYFTDFFYEGVGGGATNVALGATKLGLRSTLISEIGQNAFKRVIIEKLDLVGVGHTHALFSHDYYNCSTVLLSQTGARTVINYRTHNTDFLKNLPDDTLFSHARALYLGNISHVSEWHRAKLLRFAKEKGLITFVTLGIEDCQRELHLIDDILKNTDILILNTHEFSTIVRKHDDHINWKVPIHVEFPHIGFTPIVIVTDGKNGSYGYAGESVYYEPAAPVAEIVDSSGAGDGYAAGFIHDYLKSGSKQIQSAMKAGARYASHKLRHLGAN